MIKRNKAIILFIVMMLSSALFLTGCNSGQPAAPDDAQPDEQSDTQADDYGEYVPGIHEAYGVRYAVPDTDWIYMFNSDQLGTGDEFIDTEMAGKKAKKGLEAVWESSRTKDSGSKTIDGRECYWYDIDEGDGLTKVMLIPQSEENKYIEIRSDFIDYADKEKADAFYEGILNGIEFTEYKGCKASDEYITVGGVRIPAAGMKPVQFFYGLMDLKATEGLASVQIDFDEENYSKGAAKTFADIKWDDTGSLLGNGPIENDGIEGVWYTWLDEMPDSLPYMSHVLMIQNDETQTIMNIEYNFDGSVDDFSVYDDRIKELDGQIQAVK